MRQVLSIALALVIGYASFQLLFVPHQRARPAPTATPIVAALASATPPAILAVAPQRPDICQQVVSGYYANGRPIGGYLWELISARHPECFGPANATPPPLRH